jgi:hypothetical protein
MLIIDILVVVTLISLNNIVYACNPDPRQGSLVVAPGSYLSDSSDHGTNWDPADTKGQMKFDQSTCEYEKIVLGLPLNTHYEWKVAFNGHWGGDKGCNNNNNCVFNSSSSGDVLLIYDPYNDQLRSTPLSGNITTTTSGSTTTGSSNTTDLPGCNIFPAESCQSGDQYHANPGVDAKRWQTPSPGSEGYQPSYQDYYKLVGYADIIYTDSTRQSANVCLRTIHRNPSTVTFTYIFDNVTQTNNCKLFTNSYTNILHASVVASDNSTLKYPDIDFIWNVKALINRSGDYRNGQKGAVAEMFGWPHEDIKEECEFLSKAGYLGVKVYPVHEQLMSTQPMENAMNPWYFM